jgi:hypothetical protein
MKKLLLLSLCLGLSVSVFGLSYPNGVVGYIPVEPTAQSFDMEGNAITNTLSMVGVSWDLDAPNGRYMSLSSALIMVN